MSMFVEHILMAHMDAGVQFDVLGIFECCLNVGVHLEHP